MRECARNGEMHSNKIREKIRIRYNESLITLKPKNIKKKTYQPQNKNQNQSHRNRKNQ